MASFPDHSAWLRLSAWFDTGIELEQPLREQWLRALAEDEPAELVAWLRDMLAAADSAGSNTPLPGLPRAPVLGQPEPRPEVKPRRAQKVAKAATPKARAKVKAADADSGMEVPAPKAKKKRKAEPAPEAALSAGDGQPSAGPEQRAAGEPPAAGATPAKASRAKPARRRRAAIIQAESPDATQVSDALSAAEGKGQASAADDATPAVPTPTTVGQVLQGEQAEAHVSAESEPSSARKGDPVADAQRESVARSAAPMLISGARFGPWVVIGPMTSTDARVSQWRARRQGSDHANASPNSGDASGEASAEVALMVPWQWRPFPDLDRWMAVFAARTGRVAHPHIARIVDAGSDDAGTPWIACELAEGQPIDRWCRDHSLNTSARRALMKQVADAAAFAHGHGVLHGLIHPAQIVIAPGGRLRFLNFGLSELLDLLAVPHPTEAPAAGAPPPRAYAAPEAVQEGATEERLPATVAGDIYALGLIAFEVLSGSSPWQPRPPGRAVVAARGTRWPPPSALAGTLRARRALRGDLDAIVAKATQTDASQRYATVLEMAEDLARTTEHRTISAAESGLVDRLGRLAWRHPGLMSVAMAGLAVFLAAFAALSWKAWVWMDAREQADVARRQGAVLSRLWVDLLRETAASTRDWEETLARAEVVARSSLGGQPADLAVALALVGRQHAERGALDVARARLGEALPSLAGTDAGTEAGCDLAWVEARLGVRPEEAEQRLQRATRQGTGFSNARVLCLARLADLERRLGRTRDAYATGLAARGAWDASAEKAAQLAVLLARPMGGLSASLGRFHEAQGWFEWTMSQFESLKQGHTLAAIRTREEWGEVSLIAGNAQHAMKLADENLVAVTGSAFPDGANASVAVPAALFMAASEPRIELHRLAEARTRLERAIALADAQGDLPSQRRARCLMASAALRERDASAAERWLKATTSTLPVDDGRVAGQGQRTPEVRMAGGSGSGPVAGVNPAASANGQGAAHEAMLRSVPPTSAEEADLADHTRRRVADQTCRAVAIELAVVRGLATEAQREAEALLALGEALAPSLRAATALARSEAALAARQRERALSATLQALQTARALHQSDGEDQKEQPSFRSGKAALLVAEAHRAMGDTGEASKNLAYALQQMSATLPESHPWRRRGEAMKAMLTAAPPAKRP